jgi:protein arginine N-methyltransferase 1
MYSLREYGSMIADEVRMDAYAIALKNAIQPGMTVLDIGAGTGIHSFLACKFGAGKVYAVEPNDAIHIAEILAAENGFCDRIEFYQRLSTEVTLPEQVDVIVSDIRGTLPPYRDHIPAIVDGRRRHLKPGGLLIPQQDTMWAALVENRVVYKGSIKGWDEPYGLKMTLAKEIALNSWSDEFADSIRSGDLLTEPCKWATLDYTSIDEPDVRGEEIRLQAGRDGTAHGWLVWFDTDLFEGFGFSNGPGSEKVSGVYGRAFFPLFEPVWVSRGEVVTFEVGATLKGADYEWRWRTAIAPRGKPRNGRIEFDQSSAIASQMENETIAAAVSRSIPELGEEGGLLRHLLGRVTCGRTISELALELRMKYPARFSTEQEAILFVHQLTESLRNKT